MVFISGPRDLITISAGVVLWACFVIALSDLLIKDILSWNFRGRNHVVKEKLGLYSNSNGTQR